MSRAATIAYPPTTGVRRVFEAPLVAASDASLEGYGCLVDDPQAFPIEIVRWPAQGWRPVDDGSGDQGGTTEGLGGLRQGVRRLPRHPTAPARLSAYSGIASPEPPNSAGKSFSFGSPSFIGSTVSA